MNNGSRGVTSLVEEFEKQIRRANKEAIGFERLFSRMLADTPLNTSNYPPYNLEKISDDEYRITIAVAGFSKEELDISVENGLLVVKGEKNTGKADENYLFKGIADRDFNLRYQLADFVEVDTAEVANGLLILNLKREVPEAMKPKTIKIS